MVPILCRDASAALLVYLILHRFQPFHPLTFTTTSKLLESRLAVVTSIARPDPLADWVLDCTKHGPIRV